MSKASDIYAVAGLAVGVIAIVLTVRYKQNQTAVAAPAGYDAALQSLLQGGTLVSPATGIIISPTPTPAPKQTITAAGGFTGITLPANKILHGSSDNGGSTVN